MHSPSTCTATATPFPPPSDLPPVSSNQRPGRHGYRFRTCEPPPTPVRPFGLSVDPSTRRDFTLVSRLAHRTQTETATLVGVSQSTISRDLAKWRREGVSGWKRDPAVEIGEAVALYDLVVGEALGDLDLLARPAFDTVAGATGRLACRKTILLALGLKLNLLRAADLLRPGTIQPVHRGQSADEIRLKMRAAGITEAWLRQDSSPVP